MHKKLITELKRIESEPPEGCCVSPMQDNIMLWHGYVFGPEDTEWEGANLYF